MAFLDTLGASSAPAGGFLDTLGQAPAAPAANPGNVYAASTAARANGTAGGVGVGLLKGVSSTLKTLGTIGDFVGRQTAGRAVNALQGKGFTAPSVGLNPVYLPGSAAAQNADKTLSPSGAAQGIGYGTEKLAELLTPTGIEAGAAKLGAKLLPIAPKVGSFALRSVAAGLDQGGKTALGGGSQGQSEGVGVLGAVSPTLGKVGSLAKATAGNTGYRLIGSLIKPVSKTFSYGHDPIRGVLNEGITGNTFSDFAKNLSDRLQTVGQSIGALGQKVTGQGITSDFSTALQPIDDAMNNAAKQNNQSLFQQLSNVKTALTHSFTAGEDELGNPAIVKGKPRDLTTLDFSGGKQLLDDITAHTRFTGNPSDDRDINTATQQAYRSTRTILNGMADKAGIGTEARALNQRYGDLSAAQTAVNNRDIALKRQNYISLAGKAGLGVTAGYALAHGILTGDYVGAAKILIGDVGLGLGAKALGSTAVQTRAAQFLDALGPSERQGMLAANPVLKTIYQRFTGDFSQPKVPPQQ
jgi:hypothetical protein